MAHFAKVNNGTVEQVIVAEQDIIDTLDGTWVQTSYNTDGGVHLLGGTPLRKNYATIGGVYDSVRDAFYEPQPFDSWVLDEESCIWIPPTPRPDDGLLYEWDEENLSWIETKLGS